MNSKSPPTATIALGRIDRAAARRFSAFALLLLVWMLGSASARPAYMQSVPPSITLNPNAGSPGAPVMVSGSGFPPGELVALYMDKEGPFLGAPGPRADAKGTFQTTVTVLPVNSGHHTICGNTTYPRSAQPVAAEACADFTVVSGVPNASPSAPSPSPQAPATPRPSPTSFVILIAVLVVVAGVTFWLVRRGD